MTTRARVAPDLLSLIDAQPCSAITTANLSELRRQGAARLASLPKPAITPERMLAPGLHGAPDVPLLVYLPRRDAGPSPAVLHIHGGGDRKSVV